MGIDIDILAVCYHRKSSKKKEEWFFHAEEGIKSALNEDGNSASFCNSVEYQWCRSHISLPKKSSAGE